MNRQRDRRVAKADRRIVGRMLVENLRFFQSVINGVTDPILVIGTDRRVKLLNSAARDFPVLSHLKGKFPENAHCYKVLFGCDKTCEEVGRACPLVEVIESGCTVTVEHDITLVGGEVRSYEILASPLWSESGDLLGIIESLRDVTERNKATRALKESHEELEVRIQERTFDLLKVNETLQQEVEERRWAEDRLIQSIEQADLVYRVIPSAIFTVDLERNITSWNNKAEAVTGFKREEVLGKPCSIFALNPCTTRCGVFSDAVAKPIIAKECRIKTKDGRVRIISKNAELLRGAEGEVVGAVESFEDITDSKEVEQHLRTERDKFRGILSALDQGMHILNRDFIIEYQNEILREIFGDKIGEKCYQVYKQRDMPCEVCRMHEAIDSSLIQRTEEVMSNGRHYQQSYVPFEDIDGETKALILLRDITEEKAFQAETMRAGQLASIGELAAGVAHEINNPINGIINYAQILLDDGQDEEGVDMLDRVIKEGERIADIVRNLLFFARQRQEEAEIVDVIQVIEDSLALIKHQLQKDGVEIDIDIPDVLPEVKVIPQQLQQVFLNLLSNARHALNQRYPGRDPDKKLEIRSKVVKLQGSPYVRTTFTDHGTGVPEEIIENIFDPFFSSKKPGEGTGLGLSISHGLIKDFHGFLAVESRAGEQTTMIVDLPAASSVSENL